MVLDASLIITIWIRNPKSPHHDIIMATHSSRDKKKTSLSSLYSHQEFFFVVGSVKSLFNCLDKQTSALAVQCRCQETHLNLSDAEV